jgi:uncharacterized protein involved in exopolysaccharide biosynthesis
MNTHLKYDPKGRLNFQVEQADRRAYYQNVAWEMLRSIGRHKGMVVTFVAVGLMLAALAIPLMPRKYMAESLIYPNLFLREHSNGIRVQALANVDANSLINSEARLIHSDAIVRAVVRRLSLDRDLSVNSWTSSGIDWIKAWLFPELRNSSPLDRAVSLLRNKVAVTNDTRSYLISISYTTSSAEEAARVVNAFAIEYLRDKALHHRLDAVNAAEAELGRQLAIYGDKHFKVQQAAEGLDGVRAALKASMSPQDGGQDEIVTEEGVKLAVPNRTPTSPRGLMILALSFLGSLLAGCGLAVWRDRRVVKRKHNLGHQPHPQ